MRELAVREPAVRELTVLYDPDCRLCAFASRWLARQRQLVRLHLVPVGSAEARRRFPTLDHAAAEGEVTVVGDGGQLYRGDSAWIVCLWALADHREFSHTLTGPAGRRLARAAVLSAAKYRGSQRHHVRTAAPDSHHVRTAAPDSRVCSVPPGWTYDPVSGWSQAPGDAEAPACVDGCDTDPGGPG
ncbi:thiol-disulfide oxidoreductase DCC family protein [Actinacidiphila yeochonensis]|uniref:thiol-disulfide oxidoreductase DCC family protein n=1 Tax=Actinacidiphila yeochonensis TaxID=89050 RepID=UPI000561C720|nr:DCC1-like thiol-disulfide oxidoreductase family protein [Actinacidiphila yeochonensis]